MVQYVSLILRYITHENTFDLNQEGGVNLYTWPQRLRGHCA